MGQQDEIHTLGKEVFVFDIIAMRFLFYELNYHFQVFTTDN